MKYGDGTCSVRLAAPPTDAVAWLYRVVRNALSEALERSRPLAKAATIRPFLQAFTLGRRKPRYTPYEIREQIRAAEELGIDTWVLWNPRSVYQRDSLRPYRDQGMMVPGTEQ